MEKDRTVLTDAMWERIEPLLSGKATDPGRTADNRLFLEAVLWRFRTGAPCPLDENKGLIPSFSMLQLRH